MAITYPITPSLPNPVSVELTLRRVTGVSESPFTLSQQVYEHQGARWEMNVTFAPMTRLEIAGLQGFLASLKGRRGTFLYTPDPLATGGLNGATDGVLAASVTAGDTTITTTGCGDIETGDIVQIGNHVYRVTDSGTDTCEIQPALRHGSSSGDDVIFESPKGIWRLASDDVTISTDVSSMYRTTIAFVEAL